MFDTRTVTAIVTVTFVVTDGITVVVNTSIPVYLYLSPQQLQNKKKRQRDSDTVPCLST